MSARALLRIESLHLLNNASSMSKTCSGTTDPPYIECSGAVIYAYQARVELAGCTLRDTLGGLSGALYVRISTLAVNNCTFTRLESVWRPAISVMFGSTAVIESSLFYDNVATTGGIVGTCTFF